MPHPHVVLLHWRRKEVRRRMDVAVSPSRSQTVNVHGRYSCYRSCFRRELIPTRQYSDAFLLIGPRARRGIGFPTHRRSGPLHWQGTLRRLAPSLIQPCLPPFSRSALSAFFVSRRICAHYMTEMKTERELQSDVCPFRGTQVERGWRA